jgi:chromosome segregation ATPase
MGYKKLILSFFLFGLVHLSYGQEEISEQIKNERDSQLKELNEKLKTNEELVNRLTEKIAAADSKTASDKEKINDLEKLQLALDDRLKILEEAPKTKINLNGQLAFTELLSIQRDIQPVELFLTSQSFFDQLGNVTKIQQYKSFSSWKTEFDKWYSKEGQNDGMINVLQQSINLISTATAAVPLYGTMVNTAISGVTSMVSTLGKKEKELYEKSPEMLRILTVTSQFEQQKSIIDYEWTLINKELEQLQKENTQLMEEQMAYFGIDKSRYQNRYLRATLDSERELFKNDCRKAISDKIAALERSSDTRGKWLGQVETYMYKVQSLRMRFGNLTMRMQANIEQYESLIKVYSDSGKFPVEFTSKIVGLNNPLNNLKNKFYSSFNPVKYIEDSAVMYIERQ